MLREFLKTLIEIRRIDLDMLNASDGVDGQSLSAFHSRNLLDHLRAVFGAAPSFDHQRHILALCQLHAAKMQVLGYVRGHAEVLSGDVPCKPDDGKALPADTHVTVTLVWTCPDSGALRYRLNLFRDVDPSAQHLVSLKTETGKQDFVLDKNTPELPLSGAVPSTFDVAGHFLAAGVEHIFLGYDHIAFLIAIILWASRPWSVVKAVTAFTLAHSITLSLAALDVVRIPSAIIEPAIAASIVYVAVENFTTRDADKRWRETFLFGLLHGFGFASALEELGLPREKLITALAAFNCGVEIGQVLIVTTAFGLLSAADRLQISGASKPVRNPALVHAVSFAIVLLGGYWFVSRTIAS